jgi:pilus assembly protein FimV
VMSQHKRWRSTVQIIGWLLLFMPALAWPIGLGNIVIESHINQPLKAKIQLVAVRASEIKGIRVSLASARDFDWIGIKRTTTLEQLKFKPTVNDSGEVLIRVSTGRPVRERNLNFLVELRWPNGRLLREYSIELKPPPTLPVPVMVPLVPDIDNESQIQTGGVGKTQAINRDDKTVAQQPKPSVDTEPQSSSRQAETTDKLLRIYTPVRGDTLFEIAKKFLPGMDITLDQMMLAILRANPQAFIENNINGLKSGFDLQMPSATEMNRLTPQEARTTVRQQYVEWRSRSSQPNAAAGLPKQTTEVTAGSKKNVASKKAVNLHASDVPSRSINEPANQVEGKIEIAAQAKVDTANRKQNEKVADMDDRPTADKAAVEQGNDSASEKSVAAEEQPPTNSRLEILSSEANSDEPPPYSVDIQKYVASLEKSAVLTQELADSRHEEVVDIKQRMHRLESVISQQERLITLQNAQLADFNQRLKMLDEDREQLAQAKLRSESDFWRWLLIGASVPLLPLLIAIYSLYRVKKTPVVQQLQTTEA